MVILFSARNFYPPSGGAELSAYTLLKRLAEEHEIHVLCLGSENRDIKLDGMYLHQKAQLLPNIPMFKHLQIFLENTIWIRILKHFMEENKPEIVLTQLDLAPSTTTIAKRYDVPVILFIRDYTHFCPIAFINGLTNCNKKCWLCVPKVSSNSVSLYDLLRYVRNTMQYPFIKKVLEWGENAIKNADVVITNSIFLSNLVRKWFNVKAEVIYPFIDFKSVKSNKINKKEYITFIRPDIPKGVKIFIEIVKRLENEKFLCVGRLPKFFEYKKELLNLKNVKYVGWTNDMKYVYSKTKILLVPSIWPEPFGRVCVEAMINGIPCIVSSRGALPEVVGNAGIVINDVFDIESWIEAIRILNEDRMLYNKLSKRAKQRAKIFDFEKQYKKFKLILERLIS